MLVEEAIRRHEHGFPNTIEVTLASESGEIAAEGTVLANGSPRILRFDGINLEAPLEGTVLLTRNRDVPGVIGQIGTALGSLGVNIATFALGRRSAVRGADAVALVRLDGPGNPGIIHKIREIPSITEARLIDLPEASEEMRSAPDAATSQRPLRFSS
jgi:D-3-phosphoglycerate dehydrogenase / 2-oxoglutarate reductase